MIDHPYNDLVRIAGQLIRWDAVGQTCQFWVRWRVTNPEALTLPRRGW